MKRWKIVLLVVIALFAAGAIYATVLVRRGFSAREKPSWVEAFAAGIAQNPSPAGADPIKKTPAAPAVKIFGREGDLAPHPARILPTHGKRAPPSRKRL